MIADQHKKKAAWVAVCCTLVAGAEGLRTTVYLDIGGVPTYCFGETTPTTQRQFTKAQCVEMLGNRIERDYGPGVDRCVKHELPPNRKASYTSFAYNEGIAAFCKSSIAKYENAGDPIAACQAMMLYNKVRKFGVLVYSQGLQNRRIEERALCLS